MPPKEYIICRLKEHGCRMTRQRSIILDVILQENCSCCKEIYYKASKQDAKIGFATVYRMVNMLEEIGVISRKNMYRISCQEITEKTDAQQECQVQSCEVELSDHSSCRLSTEEINDVFCAGLKVCGYIKEQKIKKITWNAEYYCIS